MFVNFIVCADYSWKFFTIKLYTIFINPFTSAEAFALISILTDDQENNNEIDID